MGTAFAGIVTTFWDVSWIAGAVLLGSAFVAMLVHGAVELTPERDRVVARTELFRVPLG
jgi:hypothetical protein